MEQTGLDLSVSKLDISQSSITNLKEPGNSKIKNKNNFLTEESSQYGKNLKPAQSPQF